MSSVTEHEAVDDTLHRVSALPEPVRLRVITLAADALGELPIDDVPAPLRSFARFTPSKRARLAAVPLAGAIDADPLFRQRIAEQVRDRFPGLADALAEGLLPAAAPPADVAAGAYLLRIGEWTGVLADALTAVEAERRAAADAEQEVAARRAGEAARAARQAVRADIERLRAERDRLRHDNEDLRRKLGDTRERARRAEHELAALRESSTTARAELEARLAALDSDSRRLRQRLADAEAGAESSRRAIREGRQIDDTRLWLLLDTLVNAARGLRKELALPPPTLRPADLVDGQSERFDPFAGVGARALDTDDPAVLDQLLSLPSVHLIVDGYNVTKTGYGDLPLDAQRSRLTGGLSALAARTNAEVTCVFDGAALSGPVPTLAARGVRVRFSDPGETADELIRRLARAEPRGRPIVVVSSDREVADGVRRSGARPVSSAALLRRLDRA